MSVPQEYPEIKHEINLKYPFQAQLVDIIIPFHGQYIKVQNLLKSLMHFTKSNRYMITLVDDNSPNTDFYEKLKSTNIVNIIRHKEQKGFGAAVNTGIKNSKFNWIVVLHSDCEIQSINWLVSMGTSLLANKDKNVRLVSSRTNNPGIDLQGLTSSKFDEIKDKIVDESLPLYCAMFHRGLIDRIGFLKEYPYFGYEDEELFWRMKRKGFKQMICGSSWVYHHSRSTIDELLLRMPELNSIQEENRMKCINDLKKI